MRSRRLSCRLVGSLESAAVRTYVIIVDPLGAAAHGFGVRGTAGMGAVLGVAAVVATACSVSGSLVQDFKAGQLLGGTPWKMQLVEMITVTLLAFFLMAPVILLHEANLDTGGIGGRALPAPQAGLMAQLRERHRGRRDGVGAPRHRSGVRSCPFVTAPIAHVGRGRDVSAVRYDVRNRPRRADQMGGGVDVPSRSEDVKLVIEDRGSFIASGMIAGEAIMGIVLRLRF